MANASLKEAMKAAKRRFKKGFWSSYAEDKEAAILNATKNGEDETIAVKKLLYGANEQAKHVDNSLDEEFLLKVEAILSSSEFVLNPMSRLIDTEYYNKLTENEKQKYILTLSEKFNEAKKKLSVMEN